MDDRVQLTYPDGSGCVGAREEAGDGEAFCLDEGPVSGVMSDPPADQAAAAGC